LLDLSKLETGNLKLEVSEGDLTGFIRTIVLSFLSLAESKRISYEYDLQDVSALCFYDEDKIEKIMTNLISNALKFTPEGGSVMVTLGYSREKDVASGPHAEIRVKDTGPGIPDDEKEKIFDRFYQVSSSDSRDHEGSGIGLALASELVNLYRGEIHVESEVGKGSTFTVILPVSREHFREGEIVAVSEKPHKTKFFDDHERVLQEAAESDVQKNAVKEKDKDRPVILIVEDNVDLRKYISGNLFRHYQILEAENGREGLKKAIESIPDLIISDVMMPEMDGMEMCHQLKTDERTNHIPVIMLTARADMGSKIEGLETGADDYIIKPFDAEELRVRVKNLIEQRKKLRERYRKEFLTDPAGHEIPPPEDEFLVRVLDCTKKHLKESEFNVEQLGKELHLSRAQLYRKVLALTDYTPNEFIRNIRLKMAARMFLEGHRNVTSVLYTVGFNTPSHFTESFRELFGINPSDYIKQKAKSTK
jgi:DNA-binding response OmpR family regulator/anti-sigma regulatory factor (Ser/Thr protein kinase)